MLDYEVLVLPDFQSMVITAVTLIILYIIYRRFLYIPVSMYLQERRNLIQGEINDAKGLKEDAIALKKNQEAMINSARLEGQQIVENAKKVGEEVKENIILEAKKEAKEIVLKAEKEIERQKKLALEDIKNKSIDMGVLIASRIMEEEVNIDKQEYLIDKFIDEVGKSEWQS